MSTYLYIDGDQKVDNWVGDAKYAKIDNSTDAIIINSAFCREKIEPLKCDYK